MDGTPPQASREASLPAGAAAPEPRSADVLHIYNKFHPDYTGDGIYFTKLIPLIAENGVSGMVLAYETPSPVAEGRLSHRGVTIEYLRTGSAPPGFGALSLWFVRNARRFRIVHLHAHLDRSFAAYIVARLLGKRVLFSCTLDDSPTELIRHYRPRYRRLVRLLIRSISAYVIISPLQLRMALETASPGRLNFIPQGGVAPPPLGEGERAALRARLGLAPDDFVVLNVGSISRRKNILFMVEALARTRERRARLVVVGPALEPDYLAEIEDAVARHGLGERVMLAGFTDDPGPWYDAADLLIFASTAEGFPNVFVEALMHGLPMVVRFLPGLTDFIIDQGQSGMLVREPEDAAAAIDALAADPGLLGRMREASRDFALRNLDIGLIARAYAALYKGEANGLGTGAVRPPDLDVRFTGATKAGPGALGLVPIDVPAAWTPMLQVVIAASGAEGGCEAVIALARDLGLLAASGAAPTLLVDSTVAADPACARALRVLADQGCEIGVLLDPRSTPPFVEPRDEWHGFSGNLGPPLERHKLALSAAGVEAATGRRPLVFAAARHGIGPHSVASLAALGFTVDLSILPGASAAAAGGPDFSDFDARPGWLGPGRALLSLPETAGWLGPSILPDGGAPSRLWRRLGLATHVRLSPEAARQDAMRALTRRLIDDGMRVFTVSLSARALAAGGEARQRLSGYLGLFSGEFGGKVTTTAAIEERLRGLGG